MDLDKAIGSLLDGDAVLFAGAGFTSGAMNIMEKPFLQGNQLAKHLTNKCGISEELNLEDAADAFIEHFDPEELISELKKQYTAKVISEVHSLVAGLPWKVIYTTNYDDILEMAFKENSKLLTPVTLSQDPHNVLKSGTLAIHLNGYIHKLDIGNYGKDLKHAKSVFFLGYSLAYDLDIKRILADIPSLNDKCFFFIGESPSISTQLRAKRFGHMYKNTVGQFINLVQRVKKSYILQRPILAVSRQVV